MELGLEMDVVVVVGLELGLELGLEMDVVVVVGLELDVVGLELLLVLEVVRLDMQDILGNHNWCKAAVLG